MPLFRSRRSNGDPGDPAEEAVTGDTPSPIDGQDSLDANHVVTLLAQRSQYDLATIEAHERSHQDRPEVLNKLRYLRGSEPLPDYDALDQEQISTALNAADIATIRRVREYERKFKRRSHVLAAVTRTSHARQAP